MIQQVPMEALRGQQIAPERRKLLRFSGLIGAARKKSKIAAFLCCKSSQINDRSFLKMTFCTYAFLAQPLTSFRERPHAS